MLRKNPEHRPSASEILMHPYLICTLMLTNADHPFNHPANFLPEKPLSTTSDTWKNMAESQSSSSSCSDKDCLILSEKNIPAVAFNYENKGTDTDLASIKMDEQDVMKPMHDEPRSNLEAEQPKTIKNILMALKEGKNSPIMKANHINAGVALIRRTNTAASPKVPKPSPATPGFKDTAETPSVEPAKASSKSVKQIEVSHPLKHQLPIVDSSPKTEPRHDGISPPAPIKHAENGLPARTRQRTPPNLVRRSSFPGQTKQTGLDSPIKVRPTETPLDPKRNSYTLFNSWHTHISREIIQESEKSLLGASNGVQTDSCYSVSSSVSIQGFELSEDAATPFWNLGEEQKLPDHEKATQTEISGSHPAGCWLLPPCKP